MSVRGNSPFTTNAYDASTSKNCDISYLAHMTYEQRVHVNDLLLPIHSKLSYIGIGLVGLHVAASLYHHFRRGDEVHAAHAARNENPNYFSLGSK
jgi:cytochrome b561